jgi:hypothetical protein
MKLGVTVALLVSLLNDAVINSSYIASNDSVIVNNDLDMM